MKILFLSDNFIPESNAPAIRTYEHVKEWVNLGHKVTVLTCFPNFPNGRVYEGYSNKLYQIENIDGIRVVRLFTYMTKNQGFFRRTMDYFSFGVSSLFAGLFIKCDIIFATSPQFFSAISALLISKMRQKPFFLEIRDLWPDSIVAVGSIKKESLIFKILKKIENKLYTNSTAIISVTESFKKYFISEHKIAHSKIGVFKNGYVKKNINYDFSELQKFKVSLGLKEKKIISYVGTHGLAHGLDFVLKSIKHVQDKNYHFLFVGDGAEKNNLIKLSKELMLNNCTFLNSVPRDKIEKYILISDVCLVNLKKNDEFKNVIPSKIFENVALKKPILLGLEGEARNLIDEYKVGVSFEPENENEFISSIDKAIRISNNLEFHRNCDKMSQDFERTKIAKNLLKFVIKTMRNKNF
ncbi:MAG: hypothetical protein CBC40_04465 [bacterium TMED80]|nr:MAG: hypothetical protein CBC40_04465 [bacterium TMED80]|tara:strand:- start:5733 stop:6962 length:1230 start_codon:yes stop_codon:yes gene_type:complete